MQETWVQALGQEDPLEEEEATSSILACKISRTEEPGGLSSMELQKSGHNLATEQQLSSNTSISDIPLLSFNLFLLLEFVFKNLNRSHKIAL